MDLGLALSIAAATAVVWRLRRRRYTPRPPSAQPRPDDPDLAPLPTVVTQIRRGLRAQEPEADAGLDELLGQAEETADASAYDAEPGPESTADDSHPTSAPLPLNLPALGNPMLAAWPPAGLGLTGPGAEAAARGFLVSALAAGEVDDPHARGTVVLPAGTLTTLLGDAAVATPDTPRLTVTGDLTEALETLEEQTLYRTRLAYAHEVDTITQLREADPSEEPLPPVLLLGETTVPHERTRIAALLAQGQRLDIHGVLLGEWPEGDTVTVAEDGTTAPVDRDRTRHGNHPADVGRLTVITAAETAAMLATLAESHTGQPQPPALPPQPPALLEPPRQTPCTTAEGAAAGSAEQPGPRADFHPTAGDVPPICAAAEPAVCHDPAAGPPTPDGTAEPSDDHEEIGPTPDSAEGTESDADGDRGPDGPGRVSVRVLGKPVIVGADPSQPLRAKAMELMVYLIARDGDATLDTIIEDLVPDATMSKAPHRIHTYVYALRKALRHTGGAATYVAHPPHRYQVNRDALDADLWEMRAALAEAETATGQARTAALRRAVDAYTGPLADGMRYEWAEPYREAVRRQALDAHLALADALRDRPKEALAVLDRAIAHDPYAEDLYQAAMRLHATLNNPDAITVRFTDLSRHLEDLDTEPTDATTNLASTLTAEARRRTRRRETSA